MTETTRDQLAMLMRRRYAVDSLVGIGAETFEHRIREMIGSDIADRRLDPSTQRDQAVRFSWGHDHDFGSFKLGGAMGSRHLGLVATFVEWGALPWNLSGYSIADIGPWTGGTSLLLAAMGARVRVVEEVDAYAGCIRMLAEAFGSDRIDVECGESLFDLVDKPELFGTFDHVLLAGVLYHVTDPIVALRVAYELLAEDGTLLLESAAFESDELVVEYEGPSVFTRGGSASERTRRGWNWFIPSTSALERMIEDVGFERIRMLSGGGRAIVVAHRDGTSDMMRSGLSRRIRSQAV